MRSDSSTQKTFGSARALSFSPIQEGLAGNLTPLQNAVTADASLNISTVTLAKASCCAGSIGISTLKVLISCMKSVSGNSAKKSVGLLDYFSDSIHQLRKSKTVINVFIHGLLAGYRTEMFYLVFAAWRTCTKKAKTRRKKSCRKKKNCLRHAFSEWRVFAARQRDLSESASAIASEVNLKSCCFYWNHG